MNFWRAKSLLWINSLVFWDLFSANQASRDKEKSVLVSGNVSTFYVCSEKFLKLLRIKNQALMNRENSSELIYSNIPTLCRDESWNICSFTQTASTVVTFCMYPALTNFSDSSSFFGAKYRVLYLWKNKRAIGIHFCVFIPFSQKRHFIAAASGIFLEKITHFAIVFRLHGNQFLAFTWAQTKTYYQIMTFFAVIRLPFMRQVLWDFGRKRILSKLRSVFSNFLIRSSMIFKTFN